MKKELAIGICFGLAGILCTCLFGYEYFTTYGFLNAYHMKAFAASDTGYLPLLANILWERGKRDVSGIIPQVAPPHLRGSRGAGAHHHHAEKRDDTGKARPRLSADGQPWHRQNHLRQDLCQGSQLPASPER